MKTMFIILGVLALLTIIVRSFKYHNAISHGRCPMCGAPIEPFANTYSTGYHCTECDWWEAVDEHGNTY